MDHLANRTRTTYHSDEGVKVRLVDFKRDAFYNFTVPGTWELGASLSVLAADACHVRPLNKMSPFERLYTTAELLEPGAATVAVQDLGDGFWVRGVKASAWHAADVPYALFQRRETLVNITWYFSAPDWRFYGEADRQVPLRIEVTGMHWGEGAPVYPFSNSYEFVDYRRGVPPEGVFRLPERCGAPAPLPEITMPSVPQSFEALLEVNDRKAQSSYHAKLFRNGKLALTRIDAHLDDDIASVYERLHGDEQHHMVVRVLNHINGGLFEWTLSGTKEFGVASDGVPPLPPPQTEHTPCPTANRQSYTFIKAQPIPN